MNDRSPRMWYWGLGLSLGLELISVGFPLLLKTVGVVPAEAPSVPADTLVLGLITVGISVHNLARPHRALVLPFVLVGSLLAFSCGVVAYAGMQFLRHGALTSNFVWMFVFSFLVGGLGAGFLVIGIVAAIKRPRLGGTVDERVGGTGVFRGKLRLAFLVLLGVVLGPAFLFYLYRRDLALEERAERREAATTSRPAERPPERIQFTPAKWAHIPGSQVGEIWQYGPISTACEGFGAPTPDGGIIVPVSFSRIVRLGPNGEELWSHEIQHRMLEYPCPEKSESNWYTETPEMPAPIAVDANGNVLYFLASTLLVALGPDGSRRWEFRPGDSSGDGVSRLHILEDGSVAFVMEGTLYRVDGAGEKIWELRMTEPFRPWMRAEVDRLYVLSAKALHAVGLNGKVLWTSSSSDYLKVGAISAASGKLVLLGRGKGGSVVNRGGKTLYSFGVPEHREVTARVSSIGEVYVLSEGTIKVYGSNPVPSRTLGVDGVIRAFSLLDDDRLFAHVERAYDDRRFEILSPMGERVWSVPAPSRMMLTVLGPFPYVYTDIGLLAVADPGTSWKMEFPGGFDRPAVLGPGARIFVADREQNLRAFDHADSEARARVMGVEASPCPDFPDTQGRMGFVEYEDAEGTKMKLFFDDFQLMGTGSHEEGTRVPHLQAKFENGELVLDFFIPEGTKACDRVPLDSWFGLPIPRSFAKATFQLGIWDETRRKALEEAAKRAEAIGDRNEAYGLRLKAAQTKDFWGLTPERGTFAVVLDPIDLDQNVDRIRVLLRNAPVYEPNEKMRGGTLTVAFDVYAKHR